MKDIKIFSLGIIFTLTIIAVVGITTAATIMNAGGNEIINLNTGTGTNNAATKGYVDAAGGGSMQSQRFTSSGTWTKPSSVEWVYISMVGGGGGGSGAGQRDGSNDYWAGSGGGGGEGVIWHPIRVTGDVAITVGSGGSGGAGSSSSGDTGGSGSPGDQSCFGSLCVAGGLGATGSSSPGSGAGFDEGDYIFAGGLGAEGKFNSDGQDILLYEGGVTIDSTFDRDLHGGGGGSSALGGGADGGEGFKSSTNGNPGATGGPGAGGGGGGSSRTGTGGAGGNGGSGVVDVYWFE